MDVLSITYNISRFGHGIFFVVMQTALMIGIIAEWRRDKKAQKQQTESARVSIIIPIHNESRRMEGLLRTLKENLTAEYAENKKAIQIILIDDRSTDSSPALLSEFAANLVQRGIDCRIITLTENPGPNCKQFALSKGIAAADGDYFLFTDGDCELPQGWIAAMTQMIQDGKTGVVIGPVFKKKQGKGFLSLYQQYDHAVRYNYLAGAIGLGAAGGGFGNNLIVSRKTLEAVGGYDAIPPSPTEDAALISQIRRTTKYRIRATVTPNTAVLTASEADWRSFINQTLRWNNGGLFSPESLTRFNYNLLMLLIVTCTLAIPLLPIFPGLWPLPVGGLIVMIQNTIAAFALFHTKLPKSGLLTKVGILLCLLFTPIYFTLMTLMGYAGIKPKWKN